MRARYSPAALSARMALEGDRWSVVMLSGSRASGRMPVRVRGKAASAPTPSVSQYGGRRVEVDWGGPSYWGEALFPSSFRVADMGWEAGGVGERGGGEKGRSPWAPGHLKKKNKRF